MNESRRGVTIYIYYYFVELSIPINLILVEMLNVKENKYRKKNASDRLKTSSPSTFAKCPHVGL